MPSTVGNGFQSILPTDGPRIVTGGGAGAANANLVSHITDPTDAHPASAIGYAGGPAWADASTNPAATVEAQIDKILTDLGGTSGDLKTGVGAYTLGSINLTSGTLRSRLQALTDSANHYYAGGGTWADATTNPATTVELQFDKIIGDLASTAGANAGTRKIGGEQIVNTAVTVTAGTLLAQLTQISRATGLQYNPGPAWHDGTTNGSNTVQAAIDKIISDLVANPAGSGVSGADRIGISERTTWLGGRSNPGAVSILDAINKIITDLAATTASDDGAERIGAQANGGLLAGSVRSQLDALDAGWGKLDRAQSWTNTNTVEGPSGDTNAIFLSNTVPTNRKLMWRALNSTTGGNSYLRFYNDNGFEAFVITVNAEWNGATWESDDNTATAVMYRFEGSADFEIHEKGPTAGTWGTSSWDKFARYGPQSIFLGNTVSGTPATIICTIDGENGRLQFTDVADGTGSDSNPPSTQGHINVLKAKNIPKAWAYIEAGFTPTVHDGFNIASVSTSGNDLVVNITSDMDDANYAVVATVRNSSTLIADAGFAMVTTKTAGSFTLRVINSAGAFEALDSFSNDYWFSIVVFGKQS